MKSRFENLLVAVGGSRAGQQNNDVAHTQTQSSTLVPLKKKRKIHACGVQMCVKNAVCGPL